MKLFVTAQTTAVIGRSSNSTKKRKEFVIITQRKEHHVNAPSNTEVHHESAPSEKKCTIKTHQLTKKQLDIVNFCSVPRTSKEIMDRLGLYNQSRNRQRHIQPLIDMGFLEMTVPENPKAKGQKYRKTMQS